MKFSLNSETRSVCDEEQKSNTNIELSSMRTIKDDNRTILNVVEESIDSGNAINENLNSQKGIFTRITYNRWKCVFLHNSTIFSCSICDATCRSYQKLKQHRLLLHRAVTFLDQFKPSCCCELIFSTRNAAHNHMNKCSFIILRSPPSGCIKCHGSCTKDVTQRPTSGSPS